jgi:hypothetical protein
MTTRQILMVLLSSTVVRAEPLTPPSWKQVVKSHADKALVGQRKNTSWIRDVNRNFVDDLLEQKALARRRVDVVVDLNRCVPRKQLEALLGRFGKVKHSYQLITAAALRGVPVEALPSLARLPEVAMVELDGNAAGEVDVAARAVQSRSSAPYSPVTADDLRITGSGVSIAVIDSGINSSVDGVGTYRMPSLPPAAFVAGMDATIEGGSLDGSARPASTRNTGPVGSDPHGSAMAAIALGRSPALGTLNRAWRCRDPGADTGDVAMASQRWCAGAAPEAGLVDIKVCHFSVAEDPSCPAGGTEVCLLSDVLGGYDWVAANATRFGIRVALHAQSFCGDDDGSSVLAETANALTAAGVLVVAPMTHGDPQRPSENCGPYCTNPMAQPAPGDRVVRAPGSASSALTVGASDDRGTVSRGDDLPWERSVTGPRRDFDGGTYNPGALKPDIATPGVGVSFPVALPSNPPPHTEFQTGTSPATAVAAGLAALVFQKFPGMSADAVKAFLLSSADSSRNNPFPGAPGRWDPRLGWGLANLGGLSAPPPQAGDVRLVPCQPDASLAPGTPCNWSNGLTVVQAWRLQLPNPQNPSGDFMLFGVSNYLQAWVANDGPIDADVVLTFSVGLTSIGLSPGALRQIGSARATVPAGQTQLLQIPWTPQCEDLAAIGAVTDAQIQQALAQCEISPSSMAWQTFRLPILVRATLTSPQDLDSSDNVSEDGFDTGFSRFGFHVAAPGPGEPPIQLVAKSERAGWSCRVTPSLVPSDGAECGTEASVSFDAPANAAEGDSSRCEVIAFQVRNGKRAIVGHLGFQTVVPSVCRAHGQLLDAKGLPIPRATVTLQAVPESGQAYDPAVQRALERARRAEGGRAIRSTAVGSFEARVVPGLTYEVKATTGAKGRPTIGRWRP